MFLSRFESLSPTHLVPQADGLRWLASAHARKSTEVDAARFEKLLNRYGCGPDKIKQRGTFLRDFTHSNWADMQVFGAEPASIEYRMRFFNEALLPAVASLYSDSPDFSQWIHVTCTGYVSPSVVQILTSTRGWGEKVECLHAYHMGCYAALPALRMARGGGETDILHTELCTLHLNPSDHDPEQLVIQSLFADGVIRYHVSDSVRPESGFEILGLRENVAQSSLDQMTWGLSQRQFAMTLAREVPKSVQGAVGGIVKPWQTPDAVYAIHPGGPRIIDAVKEALGLSEEQVFFSREVLRLHGNMSSATLPHVWEKMLGEIPNGTPVISMAFGPGLTISASHMRKVQR